jgi:hypothetical protein
MNVMKLMVVALAGWINQREEDVINYAPAAWRIASLLPPGCGMKPPIRVFGHYAIGSDGTVYVTSHDKKLCGEADRHAKSRSTLQILGGNGAAVKLHEAFTDGQAEAGAG